MYFTAFDFPSSWSSCVLVPAFSVSEVYLKGSHRNKSVKDDAVFVNPNEGDLAECTEQVGGFSFELESHLEKLSVHHFSPNKLAHLNVASLFVFPALPLLFF